MSGAGPTRSPTDAFAAVRVPLAVAALRAARHGSRFGHTVHYLERTESTNDVGQALARGGAAEGTVVIAEQQTRGRGRLGRSWLSPPFRNLYLSLVLRPAIPLGRAPQVALVAGLAVADAVSEWAADAALKWPNDVLIASRKVAGILAELDAGNAAVGFIILGIGVNLNSSTDDFPPELRERAVALCAATGVPVDRVTFTNRLLSRLEERYDAFLQHGFAALRPAWERLSCLTGRHVQIDDGGRRYEGLVIGMRDDGSLRLVDAAQRESAVVAGDVTVLDGYAP
jgi:BirA family biotin operon repressor/biotin-[acetyl-CoA-carboxylase] ligase